MASDAKGNNENHIKYILILTTRI